MLKNVNANKDMTSKDLKEGDKLQSGAVAGTVRAVGYPSILVLFSNDIKYSLMERRTVDAWLKNGMKVLREVEPKKVVVEDVLCQSEGLPFIGRTYMDVLANASFSGDARVKVTIEEVL